MPDIGCDLLVSRLRAGNRVPGEGSVVLSTTLKRRVIDQDRTVVREQDIREPTKHTVPYRLPLSFADLEKSLLQYLAALLERPDLKQEITETILSCIGHEVGETPEGVITKEFSVWVDMDLYTVEDQEEARERLRAAINKLDRVEGSAASAGTCAIWQDDLSTDRLIKMPCDHAFHGSCIVSWLEKSPTCPFCRREFDY